MLRLAGPVILAEIGWMSMGIVDTIMVGPLGPAAIGASGMSNSIFFAVAVFGMGVMLGLDALVASSYGARPARRLRAVAAARRAGRPGRRAHDHADLLRRADHERALGTSPAVRALAQPYMAILGLGARAAAAVRDIPAIPAGHPRRPARDDRARDGQPRERVWQLGADLGPPRSAGARESTGRHGRRLARASTWRHFSASRSRGSTENAAAPAHVPFVFDAARVRRLLALGLPAASQVTLEVGVFAAVSALAGTLDPVSLGAHQIALNIAALAFMVPLGLSSAAAVRVGHAVGAADGRRAVQAGWTALAVGAIITGSVGVLLIVDAHADAPRLHERSAATVDRRPPVVALPPSFSCSTARRPWQPACCAASATRARRWRSTSSAIGRSGCRGLVALFPARVGRGRPVGRSLDRADLRRGRAHGRVAPRVAEVRTAGDASARRAMRRARHGL